MKAAKPFQEATAKAALAAFKRPGPRRYLVADEVGLGKTVVAREVVKALSERLRRQAVVYYVSSGPVGTQNKKRLVDFLPEAERDRAINTPDRLALIGVTASPDARVAVYALTPETSFPGRKARLGPGKVGERAFLDRLLRRAYPSVLETLDEDYLQHTARRSWPGAIARADELLGKAPGGLAERFREAIRQEFGIADTDKGRAKTAEGLITEAKAADQAKVGERKASPAGKGGNAGKIAFIGRLRRALCLACLKHQPPDIVILDEFQRYRDLIDEQGLQNPIIRQLLKGTRRPPALLLLSATPYRLFATRWEESRGADAHREFFGLLEFLAGQETRRQAQTAFKAFGEAVRRLSLAPDPADEEAAKACDDARGRRDELRALVGPYIGRTERETFAFVGLDEGGLEPQLDWLETPLGVGDVGAYRHLVDSVERRHRSDALAYWSSVPLPAQALGQSYVISKDRTFPAKRGLTALTRGARERFTRAEWPSAKLRALSAVAPTAHLALPWAGPSLPWWPLGGAWARRPEPKLLMFSRFKATPSAVAGLLSFGLEAERVDRRGGYEKAWRRRRLKLSAWSMATFHPCPWLIRQTDPLRCGGGSHAELVRRMRVQLVVALRKLDIEIERSATKPRAIGRLIIGLEAATKTAKVSAGAWEAIAGNDHKALRTVAAWRGAAPLASVTSREVDILARHALSAPGVVLGRALRRHAPETLDPGLFEALVDLSWNGLRAYLDNPVLMASLGNGDAIARAVLDGGLESVLDEHLWLRSATHAGATALIADLRKALSLNAGGFNFQTLGREGRIRLRCHAAMPYNDAQAKEPVTGPSANVSGNGAGQRDAPPARPTEVQQSFNSPFWPHVLATTSVGQEGLDFHPWCSRVLHWDLPSNPLDLEQREGRVQRFAGLAVRRRLGEILGPAALATEEGADASPWRRLAALAETHYADASGISPWWVLPGARVRRHIFNQPFSRDAARVRSLREQRFLYRLALGQPNQEDLLETMAGANAKARAMLHSLALDLCPFQDPRADCTRTALAAET